MNFSLGATLEEYVSARVDTGPFNNASEVVRDALRLHEEHTLKLAMLRTEVQKGIASLDASRISHSGPAEVKQKALARKKAR